MKSKYQKTKLYENSGNLLVRLDNWSRNPWRRFSLLLIIFFGSFYIGSSLGMITGSRALMDPVVAFLIVVFIECLIRLRRKFSNNNNLKIVLNIMDSHRIGLVYGLFVEGSKLF